MLQPTELTLTLFTHLDVPQQSLHTLLRYRIQHAKYISDYQSYCAILQDYYQYHLYYWYRFTFGIE